MRRHARRLADRLAGMGGRQPALVQRVPGLVQHAEQAAGEIRLVVAGGDPHVGRRAAAERVRRAVQPGVAVVEPRRRRKIGSKKRKARRDRRKR